MTSTACWICGNVADSREHRFKSRDLKRLFDADGYEFDNLPFHFNDEASRRLPGPNSEAVKYRPILCSRCNNARTARGDRAYDRLSDWLDKSQGNGGAARLDLKEALGCDYQEQIQYLKCYFAKSLGCRAIASNVILPDNFPNPVAGTDLDGLRISICRTQPMRNLPNYEPSVGERLLGKGPLIANYSKSFLKKTGLRKISQAIWWETIGHFQITHWFNIQIDPLLGMEFDGSSVVYRIIENTFDLAQMREATWAWLISH